ncbi:hypothetical protein M8J75_003542, partial [Diaphorina citri]
MDNGCSCVRPFLGHTCQYNFTAATFGHENTTNSLVTVAVGGVARRAVRNIVDISMFIRTRQLRGAIFYLGGSGDRSSPSSNGAGSEETSYIAAEMEAGELFVRLQFNSTPESYNVVRNVTLVQVKLNGTEYFRKTISSTGILDVQVLYLGGIPETVHHHRSIRSPYQPSRSYPRSYIWAVYPKLSTIIGPYEVRTNLHEVIRDGPHTMKWRTILRLEGDTPDRLQEKSNSLLSPTSRVLYTMY